MATHSSTLAWKIPWREEPGGLQSMGSQRVGHNWVTSLSLFWYENTEGTPTDLPGEKEVWEDFTEMVTLKLGSEAWIRFWQVHKPFLGREETTVGPGRCKNSRQVWGGRAARCDHTGLHQMMYVEWEGKKGVSKRKLAAKDTLSWVLRQNLNFSAGSGKSSIFILRNYFFFSKKNLYSRNVICEMPWKIKWNKKRHKAESSLLGLSNRPEKEIVRVWF